MELKWSGAHSVENGITLIFVPKGHGSTSHVLRLYCNWFPSAQDAQSLQRLCISGREGGGWCTCCNKDGHL